jgi:hypothetical protein
MALTPPILPPLLSLKDDLPQPSRIKTTSHITHVLPHHPILISDDGDDDDDDVFFPRHRRR